MFRARLKIDSFVFRIFMRIFLQPVFQFLFWNMKDSISFGNFMKKSNKKHKKLTSFYLWFVYPRNYQYKFRYNLLKKRNATVFVIMVFFIHQQVWGFLLIHAVSMTPFPYKIFGTWMSSFSKCCWICYLKTC